MMATEKVDTDEERHGREHHESAALQADGKHLAQIRAVYANSSNGYGSNSRQIKCYFCENAHVKSVSSLK